MVFCSVIVLITVAIVSIIIFYKWKFLYWHNKNVPYIEPRIPFGSSGNLFKRQLHMVVLFQKFYDHFRSLECRYGGLYSFFRPTLMLIEPEIIKNVMSKDFQYFTDRGTYFNEKDDPLSAHLFNLEGNKWRQLRAKLTPTFTSGKIKQMFSTLVACSRPLEAEVNDICKIGTPLDTKEVLAKFTTDVIGSCAFGIECNSFKDEESEFRKYGQTIFKFTSKLQILKFAIAIANPKFARRIGIRLTNRKTERFFMKVVDDTINYRKRNNVIRNDFLQLLMVLQQSDGITKGLTNEQITAQAFVFFLAGFETSSTTMTLCLYELATNQEIQEKLRNEITRVLSKFGGNITYEAVMEMKYLGNVIDETLRKYPPVGIMLRVCVEDYQVPDSKLVLESGTRITIPIYSLHHDAEYFPDPEKFDPDRFNEENRSAIRPFTYMPFGEGPRICIGLRFGVLQTKVGLVALLKNFMFHLNDKTLLPIQFDPTSFILNLKGGLWLDVQKI